MVDVRFELTPNDPWSCRRRQCYAGVLLALLRSLTQGVRRVLEEMQLLAWLLAHRMPSERRGETITPPGSR